MLPRLWLGKRGAKGRYRMGADLGSGRSVTSAGPRSNCSHRMALRRDRFHQLMACISTQSIAALSLMAQPFAKDVVMDGVRGRGENFVLGLLAGLVAAAIGAGVWMAVTVMLKVHVGFVALGVGALVGLSIRVAGNGRNILFGIMGALLTLAGCLCGEVLAAVQSAVTPEHDFYSVLTTIDLVALVTTIFTKMDVIMYVIYGIGIFEGYKLSMRK